MKIFITGADGFIGQHLVQRLHSKHELEFLKHDLRDHKDVRKQLLESNPDVIVHLAARTEVQDSFYEQITFSEINYVGTVNLIEIAKELPNLQNFVFASTMEVYGWQPISEDVWIDGKAGNKIFDEHTVPQPNAPYAVAKYGCEKYLEYAGRSYQLPYTIIRQTNSYGRKDNDFFVVERIITQMLKNKKHIDLGYKIPYRNFLYIDDLIDAWDLIISNPDKVVGEIFTLGPDNPIQIKDLVDFIGWKLEWAGEINWNTQPKRPGEVYYLNSGHTNITEKLGWSPKIDLSTGLDLTIETWKKNLKL